MPTIRTKLTTTISSHKLSPLLASLTLSSCILFSGIVATTLHAENMRNIEKKGEFEICVSPRAMPFSDLLEEQAGRLPGLQIDIGKEVAKRLKVELKTSWLSYRYQAKYTTCDAFPGVARLKNEPENLYLKKTVPYFKVELLLATRPGTTLKSIEDFRDKRVAVSHGSLVHDVLRKKGIEVFVSYTTDEKKLKALEKNEIDVALVSNIGLGWYLKNNPGLKYQTISSKVVAKKYEYDYAFGLRRADFMTVRDFNDIITAMIDDGSFERIFNRYGIEYKVNKFVGEFIR